MAATLIEWSWDLIFWDFDKKLQWIKSEEEAILSSGRLLFFVTFRGIKNNGHLWSAPVEHARKLRSHYFEGVLYSIKK